MSLPADQLANAKASAFRDVLLSDMMPGREKKVVAPKYSDLDESSFAATVKLLDSALAQIVPSEMRQRVQALQQRLQDGQAASAEERGRLSAEVRKEYQRQLDEAALDEGSYKSFVKLVDAAIPKIVPGEFHDKVLAVQQRLQAARDVGPDEKARVVAQEREAYRILLDEGAAEEATQLTEQYEALRQTLVSDARQLRESNAAAADNIDKLLEAAAALVVEQKMAAAVARLSKAADAVAATLKARRAAEATGSADARKTETREAADARVALQAYAAKVQETLDKANSRPDSEFALTGGAIIADLRAAEGGLAAQMTAALKDGQGRFQTLLKAAKDSKVQTDRANYDDLLKTLVVDVALLRKSNPVEADKVRNILRAAKDLVDKGQVRSAAIFLQKASEVLAKSSQSSQIKEVDAAVDLGRREALSEKQAALQPDLDKALKVQGQSMALRTLVRQLAQAKKEFDAAVKGNAFDDALKTKLPALASAAAALLKAHEDHALQDDALTQEWLALKPDYTTAAAKRRSAVAAPLIDRMQAARTAFNEAFSEGDMDTAKTRLALLTQRVAHALGTSQNGVPEAFSDLYIEHFPAIESVHKKTSGLRQMVGKDEVLAGPAFTDVKALLDGFAENTRLTQNQEYDAAGPQLLELAETAKRAAPTIDKLSADFEACRLAWQPLPARMAQVTRLPPWNQAARDLQLAIASSRQEIEQRLSAIDFSDATVQKIAALKLKLDEWTQLAEAQAQAQAQFEQALKAGSAYYGKAAKVHDKMSQADMPEGFESAYQEGLLAQQLIKAAEAAGDYAEAKAKVDDLKPANEKLLKIYFKASERAKESTAQLGLLEAGYETLRGVTPELKRLVDQKNELLAQFNELVDMFRFDEADVAFVRLQGAVEVAMAASKKQEAEAGPRKDAAKQAIGNHVADGTLAMRSLAEKTQLLADLQGAQALLTDDEKKLKNQLYLQLQLDEEFVVQEDARQQQIVDALANDPVLKAKLKEAQAGWSGGKTEEQKLEVLAVAHQKQCATLGIPAIPVLLIKDKPNSLGGFAPDKKVIELNSENDMFRLDFAGVMDTVLHETSHWFQQNLIERFNKGEIKPTDPDYAQVLLFSLNNNRADAYTSPGSMGKEEEGAYEAQPLEKHAMEAGARMSKALVQALAAT